MRLPVIGRKAHPTDQLTKALLEEMERKGVYSDEYPRLLAYLERLNEVQVSNRRDPFSWDKMLVVGGNLLGVIIIVAYEQAGHPPLSKGFSWINRPKTD